MLSPKHFLLEECDNVSGLLRNTLRFAYSSKSSGDVYAECLSRIQLIAARIAKLKDDQLPKLHELWVQLSHVSVLIGRIERSHIEEFSWPFAHALQDLVNDVCGAASKGPLFFISAEDALASYAVEAEENEPGLVVRPLFNIVFPRSLKHSVLLHPILGHEVGHAAFGIPQLGAKLELEVVDQLIEGSPLEDRTTFETWLAQNNLQLDPELIDEALLLWPEELLCDLFALLMIGPSYLGANCSLLQPAEIDIASDSHPPALTRYWMVDQAVEVLDLRNRSIDRAGYLHQPVNAYFDSVTRIACATPPGLTLLRRERIAAAIDALRGILGTMGNALFPLPDPETLRMMVARLIAARPPVESIVSLELKVGNPYMDFRWILYAGWLAWHSAERTHPALNFMNLNLLCGRGVLQQSAVERIARRAVVAR